MYYICNMKEIIIRIQIENGVFNVSTKKNNTDFITNNENYPEFVKLYESNPKTNKVYLAKVLRVSRQTIYRWIEIYKKDLELKKV